MGDPGREGEWKSRLRAKRALRDRERWESNVERVSDRGRESRR